MKITTEQANEVARCPKCRGKIVRRDPKPGQRWWPFFGCASYPRCDGKLSYDDVGYMLVGEEPPCPLDGMDPEY